MILYKYMSLERKNFWTDYKLRFTQPSAFNDPFDCLPSYSFIPEQLMPGYAGFEELAALFYGLEKDSSQFNDDTAIFCMSQVWDSILMWAHYADSHKGFVVGFDMSHPFFDFGKPFGTRRVKLCMPENEKMDMYQKASRAGIQCYQVMRNYQTFDLHSIDFEDFLSLQRKYYIMQRDLEQANIPSKQPSQTLRTADIVTGSLERCAEILSSIIEQTYQKFDNKINESNIKEYSDAIQVYAKALEEINCLPDAFHLCDSSISREVYETRIKHIQKNFDNCIYHVIGLIQHMLQSAQGQLPDTEEYLSTKINEKIGGAVSSFASSVSWAAIFLEEQEFRKIINKITFEEGFQKMHANDEGWQNGQKIVKRWYEMKHSALEISNTTALERYRTTSCSG